jgi:RHS repeat-associated protein
LFTPPTAPSSTASCSGVSLPCKRYRYTNKERDDSSGLCYYSARYLAPWLARWISPDSVGAIAGLNLYVYKIRVSARRFQCTQFF